MIIIDILLILDVHCCATISLVMQEAVKKHYALLQMELDRLKAKVNAHCNTDLLSPPQNGKLELLLFNLAWTEVTGIVIIAVHKYMYQHVYQVKLEFICYC